MIHLLSHETLPVGIPLCFEASVAGSFWASGAGFPHRDAASRWSLPDAFAAAGLGTLNITKHSEIVLNNCPTTLRMSVGRKIVQ